jgi:hypothetical protein
MGMYLLGAAYSKLILSKPGGSREEDEAACGLAFVSWSYFVDEYRDLVYVSLAALVLFVVGLW